MHYMVEFTGVRPRKEMTAIAVTWDGQVLNHPALLSDPPVARERADPAQRT